MRAVGVSRFGGPDALELLELPEPHPGPGEVRIRVRAAAVNPADTLIRSGLAAAAFSAVPPPYIPGLDIAGVIDEVGTGAAGRLLAGQRVMAMINPTRPAGGGYAEYVTLPANWVAPMPAAASFAEAATLPLNALTARRALDHLGLSPGQTIAVTGAAGAVGGYVTQLGKAEGLTVVADAASKDRELVLSLGADLVVQRGEGFADGVLDAAPGGVDGLVDAAVTGAAVVRAVADGGRIALVRGGGSADGILQAAVRRGIDARYVVVHDYDGQWAILDALRQQADAGVLTLRVAHALPLEQAADAHRQLAAGGVRGRIVLTP